MKCPECGGERADDPIFIETLVTAWDLDVRAFFESLQRNNRPPGSSAKAVFDEACRLADEAEKARQARRKPAPG